MMIRTVILVCFLLSFASAESQVFDAGLFGGITTTQVDGDNAQGFNKLGITGGAFVRANLSEEFGIRMELAYAGKGSRRPANPDAGDYNTWGYNFNYVDVPVLGEYKMGTGLLLNAGPYFSYLISSNATFNGAEYEITNPEMERYDFGVAGGIGYETVGGFFAMSRYSMSVLPIRNSPDPGNFTTLYDGGMTNIAIHFTVGYIFGGG